MYLSNLSICYVAKIPYLCSHHIASQSFLFEQFAINVGSREYKEGKREICFSLIAIYSYPSRLRYRYARGDFYLFLFLSYLIEKLYLLDLEMNKKSPIFAPEKIPRSFVMQ